MIDASTPPQQRMISVVLCVHNGGGLLADQLASLARQSYTGPWELVVVIDRCTDDSEQIVRGFVDRLPLRIVDVVSGQGLSNARNVGIDAASGDYYLFCDADDVADAHWISSMAAAAESHPLIGGHIEETLLNGPTTLAWTPRFTPARLPTAFGRWIAPAGANFGVDAAVVREVGGFDTSSTTGEEVDFAIRAQLHGYEVHYVAEAVMHYRHRTRLRALTRQAYRYGLGNAVLYGRYGDRGIPSMSRRETVGALAPIVRGAPLAVLRRSNRGAWLRYASYVTGQFVAATDKRNLWIG